MLETEEKQDWLTKIYNKYNDFYYRIAYKSLKNSQYAEDAVAETFLKIISSQEKLSKMPDKEFKQYGIEILENKIIDILKTKEPYDNLIDIEEIKGLSSDSDNSIDFKIETKEQYEKLLSFMEDLKFINRQIIEMKYIQELSIKEISNLLNLTEIVVSSRLEYARFKLKKQMTEVFENV
jgi:RNA polymerase sigma-70 factor (ECF subfamily)